MMRIIIRFTFSVVVLINYYECHGKTYDNKLPTVGISVLVRNKEHTLPYFFSCLLLLEYPKDRMYIWIHSDYNNDRSAEVIEKWVDRYGSDYNGVYVTINRTSDTYHTDEVHMARWSPNRLKHVINLREKALNFARKMWADYLFMVDADVYLTNPLILQYLIKQNLPIVAPMLISDGLYSNFWCAMSDNYYYRRTDEYTHIRNKEKTGCFEVPMVHTAVLISLKTEDSDVLTYDPTKMDNYAGPHDDIISFAINAKQKGVALSVCNDHDYGYMQIPLDDTSVVENDYEQLTNVKLEAISRGKPIPLDPYFENYAWFPERWNYGCDAIYVINLDRRKERRKMMEHSFRELGMTVTLVRAVDGRDLDLNRLSDFKISLLPNYEDPYHKRPMKAGEVGCFMSHYYTWKEMVEKKQTIAMVLEDDIHFVPYFRRRFHHILNEIKDLDWDLIYLGRKALMDAEEEFVTSHITKPLYSYWSLGYLLTERGARKLLDANPLANMLPVDEFLPIMFNQHPNDTWKSYFPTRNLKAFSAAPLLIHPTHYTGQAGYISDTEDSMVVPIEIPPMIKTEL